MSKHLFHDRSLGCQVRRLLPGEYAALRAPQATQGNEPQAEVLMTVLGSCIAVCLGDRHARIAGMNHFMLPEPMERKNLASAGVDPDNGSARYGSHAMELLINEMLALGARREHLQAWVFGGAKILSNMNDIGASNIRFALAYLKRERIRVLADDTGGTHARKLYLDPSVGIPACLAINRKLSTLQGSEARYARSLKQDVTAPSSDISLFAESP